MNPILLAVFLFGHYLESYFEKEIKNDFYKTRPRSRFGFSSLRAFQRWSQNCRSPFLFLLNWVFVCFYWESDPAVCSDPRTPQNASGASKFDLLEVCRGAVSQPCPRTFVIIKNACLQASLVSNQNYLCNTKTVAERVGTFGDCHTYHGTTCCNSCVWPQLVTTIQIT